MAERVPDSEEPPIKAPPKRRRILDPSAVVPVPVYSNKVSSSLKLKPRAGAFGEVRRRCWAFVVAVFTGCGRRRRRRRGGGGRGRRSLSVSPAPQSPARKHSRKVKKTISEVNKKLRALGSLLSPERQHGTGPRPLLPCTDDDDAPPPRNQASPYGSPVRQIPLKIRCRTDIHRIPVLSSAPLRDVVSQLSVILAVPPPRLLLLRDDVELPTASTIGELGIGIADILDCVVMATEDKAGGGSISIRLQGKARDSSLEFSVLRDAPLGSVFAHYLSRMSAGTGEVARFYFEGSKLTPGQTPAQLDMEDGDIIEVWI
ncbi:LOW QUALITY PROTEIN: NFATC2-interacting protein [Brachionichthys hirsutus]|uniref:LOW QUALITY PROTEIN: NFATC2-interacting protein n=1 Tax=Brachionichthys hirsutus TaxID=412623 RepID=UPI003604E85B